MNSVTVTVFGGWLLVAQPAAEPRDAVLGLMADPTAPRGVRVGALVAAQSFWGEPVRERFLAALADPDPLVRRLAVKGLASNARPGDPRVTEALVQSLADQDDAVKREAALALAAVGGDGVAGIVVNAWLFEQGDDPRLNQGLIRAVEQTGEPGVRELLALIDSGVEAEREKVLGLFRAMRSQPAVGAIPEVLLNPHLSAEQRARLIAAYGDSTAPLEPLAEYLAGRPGSPEEHLAALDAMRSRDALDAASRAWVVGRLGADDLDVVIRAVRTLGKDADGAALVGEKFLGGALPRAVRPTVLEVLTRHGDDPRVRRALGEIGGPGR